MIEAKDVASHANKAALLSALTQCVIDGYHKRAEELTLELLNEGLPAREILDSALVKGMEIVGIRFRNNEMFLPEVLASARAMKASLCLLEPILSAAKVDLVGTLAIGTVKGDVHDIGKNIVSMMFQGHGFRVIDLGINCEVERFIEVLKTHSVDILGMSALLTTTMQNMKIVIDRVRAEGYSVKVMVGGAPVTAAFAQQIGADGYARNAVEAVEKAKAILGLAH